MKVAVKNLENKKVADIELSDSVFGLPERADILHRMVNWQLSKRRAGTHKTKTISEVSGTGKKPFAQKGTGGARQGSKIANQHRGGGIVFGPVVRDYTVGLPKKFRQLALKTALSVKQAAGKLVILDEAKVKTAKTKDMAKTLETMGLTSALFIDSNFADENFVLSIRNIPNVDALPQEGINVYDILRRDTLVITKDAVAQIEARLK